MLTFKSAIAQDAKNIFLNKMEFADLHTVNDKEIPAIVDDNELLERDKSRLLSADVSGLYLARRLLYVASDEFGVRPSPGTFLTLDSSPYRVGSVTEEAGILAIEIEAVRA